MTYAAAVLAAAIAFCLGLALTAHRAREAWDRGRRSGLEECGDAAYSVTGIGS